MTINETVGRLKDLLGLLPEVTVKNAGHVESDHSTYFMLEITSIRSLARIVGYCAAANIEIQISWVPRSSGVGDAGDASHLRFLITVSDDDGRGSFNCPPAPLHVLGVFIARDLKRQGFLNATEADSLQRQWHGVVL